MSTQKQKALKRDAARYRFLRSLESRNHKNHTRTAMEVEVVGWPKDLGNPDGPQLWSSMPMHGSVLDAAVDKHMWRRKR